METIFHAFGIPLHCIDLEMIAYQNFTAIQLNVIQPIKRGDEWYVSYQPLDFTIGNKFGSKEDLIVLCTKAKKLGLKVIMDVVLRHTANLDGEDGKNTPSNKVASRLLDNPYFWTHSNNVTDFNRYNTIHGSFGLPMLDYNNWDLQDIYIEFLQELKDCGIDGFRVDMGKHFSLKDEGSNFWERVFGQFSDMFNYAECLLGCDKLNDYGKIMNVITDGHLKDPSKAVIFLMTHDTELNPPFTTQYYTDELIVSGWSRLDKRSSVLFYPRPNSNLWKSNEIRNINLSRKAS